MGKCTSCILYIKQNPTTYKETAISQRNSTLIAALLLESSTTNQSIPNNIIVLNKNKKEYKFQQKYCYFGKTFKEQTRKVHVRII
jgi:hypothetical protein